MALTLTTDDRDELERRRRSRKIRAEDARRATVILMLADGASFTTISAAVACFPDYINRYNEDPKPIRWTYSTPAYRITTDSANTVH